MIRTIFVNQNDTIETYNLTVNERKLKGVQAAIDNYSGKGEVQEITTDFASFVNQVALEDQKIQVISKKSAGWRVKNVDGYPKSVACFTYQYYRYPQHPLSELCDQILRFCDSINLSVCIQDVLNYQAQEDIEKDFLQCMIAQLQFQKSSIDDMDLSGLTKVRAMIASLQSKDPTALAHKSHFESELKYLTWNAESKQEKQAIKQKVISTFPTRQQIEQAKSSK